jgi:3'(2'), 5'-bisphosphate nucleotidase
MGSVGVKLGYIARAEKDLTFKDNSGAKVWDIAAPQAILEAAGGKFTTMSGRPFNYNRIQTRGGILASNGVSHDEVVRRAAPVLKALGRSKK